MKSMSRTLTVTAGILTLLYKTCENCALVSAFTMSDLKVNTFSVHMGKSSIFPSVLLATPSNVITSSDATEKSKNVSKNIVSSNVTVKSKKVPKKIVSSDATVKSKNFSKKKKKSNGDAPKSLNKNKPKKRRPPSKRFNKILPLTSLTLGSKVSGVVAGISPFGAFVKTSYKLKPGKDHGYALLHISQMKDTIVDDVANVLKVGQKLKDLRVISINYAKGEVSLSLRSPRPKRKELSEFSVGDMHYGKVRNITPYGAFVDVGCKINLLLHKSRISKLKVENIADFIKVGEKVNVRILSIDEKEKNLAGSMLDLNTDMYLNKRKKVSEKKTQNSKPRTRVTDEKSEKPDAEMFDDAMRNLGEMFQIEE